MNRRNHLAIAPVCCWAAGPPFALRAQTPSSLRSAPQPSSRQTIYRKDVAPTGFHTGGELDGPAYSEISCFHQVPAIDDDGFTVAESGAVLLYLAEKAGKLIPADVQGRSRVVQWCFAALNTVERPLMEIQLIDKFGSAGDAEKRRAEMVKAANRWFDGLERRLEGRDWIACADFTIADILLATILRNIRKTDLLVPYPRLTAYYAHALARPAWRHTLSLYVKRLGVEIADIQ